MAHELSRRLHLAPRASERVVGGDDLAHGALLSSQARELFVVGRYIRPRHLGIDLAIALRYRLQAVNHPLLGAGSLRGRSRGLLLTFAGGVEGADRDFEHVIGGLA